MESKTIKPSKIFYGISAVIFVAGIISFIVVLITGISSSMDSIGNRFVVPGSQIIELKDAGNYSIYFEYSSIIDGKVYETSSINGLVCTLTNNKTGDDITLKNPTIDSDYSMNGRKGKSLFDFSIEESGKYTIQAKYESGEGEKAVLAIGQGFGMAIIRIVLISIGILLVGIGGGIAIFILTFVKRKKAMQNFHA